MALEMVDNPANNQQLARSTRSLKEAYVLFVNTTQRHVNIYWIDYHGHNSLYKTLRPAFSIKVNTFQTHPWTFRDHLSGERMQVAHNYIFWPKGYAMPNPRDPTQLMQCRKQVAIHLPVRTLRETCLWKIARDQQTNVETVDACFIPLTLKFDLKLLLRDIQNHRTTLTSLGG